MASEPRSTAHVLVVDDDADHTAALASLLTMHGWTASRAHSGGDALAAVSAGQVDAIICDLSLGGGAGGVGGLEVAREVRARRGAEVVLVAYTGSSAKAEHAAALAAGFDAFLLKPATVPTIIDTVVALLDARHAVPAADASPAR